MRILHLITRMDRGGSAVNTLLSGLGQLREGHEVVLAMGPSDESEMSVKETAETERSLKKFSQAGGKIHVLPSLLRRLSVGDDVRAVMQMRRLLRQPFDIIHTHTSKAGALGRLAAWGCAAKVVHTPHGHIFHGYFGRVGTWVFVLVERFLANWCDVLVALTKQERDDHKALKVGRDSQWHVIPSGVDVETLMCQTRSAARTHEWKAVSVGRLVPIKGMDRLVRAWSEVVKRDANARLAIVGDGSELPGLKSLAVSLGTDDNIHFAGWTDPLPYLQSAGCFVLLSRNEGMGRAVVEAMATGLPCVVADICGLRELVDTSVGARVNADNPEEVAEALLCNWPSAVSDAARERAGSYSVELMVSKLLQLYEGLLNNA